MAEAQWARLREDVDCGLRRGAWYRTLVLGRYEVLLDVHGRQRCYSRRSLEIATTPPTRWTIVSRARNAAVIPARWSKAYAVCPTCRWRQLPLGQPEKMRCEGCNGVYEVAWNEPYLVPRGSATS